MMNGFWLVIHRADVLRRLPMSESVTCGEVVSKCNQYLLLVLHHDGQRMP